MKVKFETIIKRSFLVLNKSWIAVLRQEIMVVRVAP